MDIEKMLKRIRDSRTESERSKKSDELISYDSEAGQEDLSYIDKFLRIISDDQKISISYEKADTAHINMVTNEIVLPTYILQDRDLYLLMGSHEVSHALHTPREFYESHNKSEEYPVLAGVELNQNFFMCINIVEDIRIERLIREKFPGFRGVYRRAYRKLISNQPAFMINSQSEWDALQIHNKVNMYAKAGDVMPYTLTKTEMAIYENLADTETFNDVLVKSLILFKLINKEAKSNELEMGLTEVLEDLEELLESSKEFKVDTELEIDEDLVRKLADASGEFDDSIDIEEDIFEKMEDAQRQEMSMKHNINREIIKASNYEGLSRIAKNPMSGLITM